MELPELEISAPTRTVTAELNVPRALLAPKVALADVNGITVVLAAVELWTRSVVIHLEGLRSRLRDDLDTSHRAAFEQWASATRDARDAGNELPLPGPPRPPGEWLGRLPLTLRDDAGTDYRRGGVTSGGTGTEWLSKWAFAPEVPDEASRLSLVVGGSDGQLHACEVALPASR